MEFQQEQIRQQQKQSWNRFSGGWKNWDKFTMRFLHPMGEAIIDHLKLTDSDKVLDIAAGTGEPGLTIAAIVKNGSVTGTDLSENMLAIAEDNAGARGLKNYSTSIADVCELPFPDNSFDKISCRMGFMFFPDMQIASNEMYRVLKPGGRLATSVWGTRDQNFWVTCIMDTINKHMELPPPIPGAPGMFRCASKGMITDIFLNSGFKNVAEETITGKADFVDADTYWRNMIEIAAPVVAALDKADEATTIRIKAEVYSLINANSIEGRALLSFGSNIIYGEKE